MFPYPTAQSIKLWPIERLVEYTRNPRKNDAAIDRMCSSIRECRFRIPRTPVTRVASITLVPVTCRDMEANP